MELDASEEQIPTLAMSASSTAERWHQRLGHVSGKTLDILRKTAGTGVSFEGSPPACDVCKLGKSKQQPHPKTTKYNVSAPFELLIGDLMGPISPSALRGFQYVSKITDVFSRWTTLYLMKSQSDTLDTFKLFVHSVVMPMGRRVHRLRTDKGGEYIGKDFRDYCINSGVKLEFAATATAQQIGISERVGGVLVGMVRCWLASTGLPAFLWGELLMTAAHVSNRVPHSALKMETPYKRLYGVEADLSYTRVIGTQAFVHIDTYVPKLKLRAVPARLVGYAFDSKGYRLWDPVGKKVIESRNVAFIESPARLLPPADCADGGTLRGWDSKYTSEDDFLRGFHQHASQLDLRVSTVSPSYPPVEIDTPGDWSVLMDHLSSASDCSSTVTPLEAGGATNDTHSSPASRMGTRSNPQSSTNSGVGTSNARTRRELNRLAYPALLDPDVSFFAKANLADVCHEEWFTVVEYAYAATNTQMQGRLDSDRTIVVPNTYKEAMELPEADRWREATKMEFDSLLTLGVFERIPLSKVPPGAKLLGTRWVFKLKPNGLFKGRVVVQGWSQVPGIDCGGTYAPVCRLQSIRMLLAVVAALGWSAQQLDVVTAFLNAVLDNPQYAELPPGYEDTDSQTGEPCVMLLKKALYGLKDAPRHWYLTIDSYLGEIGFLPLKSDPCVYVYVSEDSKQPTTNIAEGLNNVAAILALYVDDVILIGGDDAVLSMLKKKLTARFKMKDLGDASLVLGMEISRDLSCGTVSVTQAPYVRSILKKFGMDGCNKVNTPGVGPELSTLVQQSEQLDAERTKRFQAIVGSVIYLAQVTRYDILFAVNQLARAMTKPSKAHLAAAKHLLRYLAGTIDFCITYKKDDFKLTAFSDANWGNNPDNAKSTSSYIIMLSKAPVSFKVGLQSMTAQSTMEAELVAAALAMKEAVFCSNMMLELGFGSTFNTVPVYLDNKSAIRVASNRAYSGRTKHIAPRFFFVQELVESGKIAVRYIPTQNQLADLGTKFLATPRFRELISKIQDFGDNAID